MKRTELRLPDELHQFIKDQAKKSDRSLNAEIVFLVRSFRDRIESEKQCACSKTDQPSRRLRQPSCGAKREGKR